MKYDLLLMRMFDEKNPLTEDERQWVHKQASTARLVEALYIEHVNKVMKREAEKTGTPAIELVKFHVSLGDNAQESSVFEILESLIKFDITKSEILELDD